MGAQALIEDVQRLEVVGVIEVLALEDAHLRQDPLGDLDALVRQRDTRAPFSSTE